LIESQVQPVDGLIEAPAKNVKIAAFVGLGRLAIQVRKRLACIQREVFMRTLVKGLVIAIVCLATYFVAAMERIW